MPGSRGDLMGVAEACIDHVDQVLRDTANVARDNVRAESGRLTKAANAANGALLTQIAAVGP